MIAAVVIGWRIASGASLKEQAFAVKSLKVCHMENPLGLDEEVPVFSWQMTGGGRGAAQSAYRLMVAESRDELMSGELLWDSGRRESAQSVGITYEGEELLPKHRYFWQVEVWDQDGKSNSSQEEAWFETGLMGESAAEAMGEAKWISAPRQESIGREDQNIADQEAFAYTIKYHLELADTAVSFLFGAQEGRYGSMYHCEIAADQTGAVLRLKEMDNNTFLRQEEVDINSCLTEDGSFYVELQIRGEELLALVNGNEAGSFVIDPVPVGSIGYYKSRGVSYGWMDDILVTDAQGNVIYQEDFQGDNNIFDPFYTQVEEGRLRIGSGLLLTPGGEDPAPLFRREFLLPEKEVESARVYMTALGSFTLSINGQRVSEDYFSPGKLIFNQQLSYVAYDVTEFLQPGEENALGIILLHGWYDRAVGYTETWNPWGDTNALLGRMEIQYADGTREEIVTDQSFTCSLEGPVRSDDLYQGEYYDARLEQTGFDTADFAGDGWMAALEDQVDAAYDALPLTGKRSPSIVCVEELVPVSVTEPVENVYVYDFGQNFAGTCRIKVTGSLGQVLTLRYGEELNGENMVNCDDEPGTIWTENLMTAEATDYYVMRGDPEGEEFEPEFVFHGFRYLQITGLEEAVPIEQIKGLVLSSDLEQTGEFISSHEGLNRYYENTVWSQRSNFMDNPMDCSQRDERHGWAGDAQIFSLTASYHMDTYTFYEKFLREMQLLQTEGGSFPDMAPRNFGTQWDGTGGSASNNCWGDAPVVIAWNLYLQYGDERILEENYDALKRWVDMLVSTSDHYIRYWGGYGDHLSLEDTPTDVSDTAWCAHSADLLSRMAGVLEQKEDQEYYRQVYEEFRQAWQRQYVQADGSTLCNTQTSYALGLSFGLFPEELREAAAGKLAQAVENSGYHVLAGFSGIGYLLSSLSDNGYEEAAYKLLLQQEYPSFLYPVDKGATTTWELMHGYQEQEDGYYLEGSLNHYAFGTPAGWLYTDVLGIKADEADPGFQHILLEPKVGGGLSFAKGSYNSVYGRISVSWEQTEAGYEYLVEIPANTSATLTLPAVLEEGSPADCYLESGKAAADAKGVEFLGNIGDKVKYELVSGSYHFVYRQ